jgi:hypothetical protein
LAIAPRLAIDEQRLTACTPSLVRLLWLFSYVRRVTVDCRRQQVTIATTRLWFLHRTRVLSFDQIDRIVYCGQGMPTLSGAEPAFFLISLGLKDRGPDIELFTVIEDQPQPQSWLDGLSGAARSPARVGDEAALRIVDLLHRYIGVPIARH